MDSTQAIREAIQFIECSIEHAQECDLENTDDESLHCEFEGLEEMQEVISQLKRLPQYDGSNYGTLWSIDDLRIYRPAWDDDTLTKWFTNNGNQLANQACDDGFETIRALLDVDDMCEGCGEDSSDDVCPKCNDDYEITRCNKCDHVMRREHLDDDICQKCS
jgi:hypothetical protein